ncbi:MAG: hypothetical protein KKC75_07410 [Nanoarchaeota archaeon]|nr:hypothetical protein [Nanoarchaeota archaeon]MBU1004528.1 hypothetical protein [Nanoarchaeota archaeon]MBU1945935.1 hypothetical protein [Nanoarchaeota archaeon]
MTTIEEHTKILKGLLDDINEKIRANLLVERQKIVGFSASEAATNLFAVLLHKKSLVEAGFNVNHRFFASEKIAMSKFDYDFPKKGEIIQLLVNQEGFRDKLCYGKEKNADIVDSAVKNLFKLKELIDSIIGENNE